MKTLFADSHDVSDQDWLPLRSLGLNPYQTIGRDWTELGEVNVDGVTTVSIAAAALPAVFYRFEIARFAGERRIVRTGSGCVQQYWPKVVRLVHGDDVPSTEMFGVERVR
jgi:hypothetical protein